MPRERSYPRTWPSSRRRSIRRTGCDCQAERRVFKGVVRRMALGQSGPSVHGHPTEGTRDLNDVAAQVKRWVRRCTGAPCCSRARSNASPKCA